MQYTSTNKTGNNNMAIMGWKLRLASVLLILSFVAYILINILFGNIQNIQEEMLWFFQSMAFLPIEVLLVTLIIDSVLTIQEKRQKLEKMSMVTDAFFSEVGLDLIRLFLEFDRNAAAIRAKLNISQNWTDQDYSAAEKSVGGFKFDITCNPADFERLRSLLVGKRDFLLRLIENPNLLEHESFTEMLRATFHVIEELIARSNLNALPRADHEHLQNDITRAYTALVGQWLDYMLHLKKDYPYLYSLATRTNPFNPNASAEIR